MPVIGLNPLIVSLAREKTADRNEITFIVIFHVILYLNLSSLFATNLFVASSSRALDDPSIII